MALDSQSAQTLVSEAEQAGNITAGAAANIHKWLTEARFADYLPLLLEHIAAAKWKELDDAFWTVIPLAPADDADACTLSVAM